MQIYKLPTGGFIQVLGVQNLMRQLGSVRSAVGGGFVRGGHKAANVLLRRADYYVPIDTKELRDSGRVKAVGTGLDTEYTIIYEAAHAVVVHEDLDANHGSAYNIAHAADIAAGRTHRRRPQEQAKWLEVAARESRPVMRHLIRKELKHFIRKAIASK